MLGKISLSLLLFFVFSFLFRADSALDQDLGRHIKLGGIIVKTHQVPKTNLFSYTNPAFPFINTHWLFETVAYGFSQTVGLQAFLILKVLIFLLSVWLILKIVPKRNQLLLLPIGFVFLHVLRERLELRPEIFSFLFTALSYYILEKNLKKTLSLRASEASVAISHTEKIASSLESPPDSLPPRNDGIWQPIFLLPIIQLIWINTHIYFFVGLILQVIYIIYIGYQTLRTQVTPGRLRMLGIVFILSVLVSFINPNGLKGILYPLNVSKNYGYSIVENQTMFFLENSGFKDDNFLFVKLCWVIIILSLTQAAIRKNFDLKNALLAITGMGLSFLNVRSFPYLVFLSFPATIANLSPGTLAKPSASRGDPPRWISLLIFTIVVPILLWESFSYLSGQYYKQTSDDHMVGLGSVEKGKAAVDFVINNDLAGPIFNNFDIGSYIIYRGFPKYKVFVDGRPEAYPSEFFTNTYIPIQSDYAKFKMAEKEFGFKTIIFSHTDQTPWGINFLNSLVKDSTWKLIYIDDFMVIFVRGDVAEQKGIKIIDLSDLDPESYQFENHVSYLRMGIFLLRTQNTLAGKKFIEKATVTSLLTL